MARKGPPRGLTAFHPAVVISTWFGAGLLPKAPGSWGSLAALPFAWGIRAATGPTGLAVATAFVVLVGWWAASVFVRRSNERDPRRVVIDEVAGQWLTLIPAPLDPEDYVLGFLLFRAADILKPWPVSWADRELRGGFGVMADDVLAGIYACAALWALAETLS
jgi:phosphatidylglycerophosphatase A